MGLKENILGAIKNALLESLAIKEFSIDNAKCEIKLFEMTNTEDFLYIKQHQHEIWDILQNGYSSLGGFKGYQTIKDMIKKTIFFKLGYCNGEIVTVTVYNDYLGGAKCVGATRVKNEYHSIAVKLLEFIIEHNIIDWNNWIWIEASGRIEEICREAGAFNVPSKFIEFYISNPTEIIDDYHYSRKIAGKNIEKTIFGFNSNDTFNAIKSELAQEVADFFASHNLSDINESFISQTHKAYLKSLIKKDPVYLNKIIIDFYVGLKDDELYNEFREEDFEKIHIAINSLRGYIKTHRALSDRERYILKLTIEDGYRILRTSTILVPIKPLIKLK